MKPTSHLRWFLASAQDQEHYPCTTAPVALELQHCVLKQWHQDDDGAGEWRNVELASSAAPPV